MRKILNAAVAAMAVSLGAGAASALDKVTFGTNWKAQAEHGGFYYAVAYGVYEKYGLEVSIRPGGPQVNHPQLLAAGRIDFNMGGNLNSTFNFIENNVPMTTVAAIFQKDPQVFLCHPNAGRDKFTDAKNGPVLIGKGGQQTYWQWLKVAYGFKDEQIRPYTFNPGPFLADKTSCQQGYVTSEPFAVQRQGVTPVVHLLADHGYDTYSTTIETSWKLAREKSDLVQRFVDASVIGWYGYLYKEKSKADDLIKKDNPDMDDPQIAFSLEAMKKYGIVDSGDSKTLGIGAMTDARIKSFYDKMVSAGLYKSGLAIKDSYTLQFVNKKVGM
jgi:NitT/TauT family transport system substrate-binding protein